MIRDIFWRPGHIIQRQMNVHHGEFPSLFYINDNNKIVWESVWAARCPEKGISSASQVEIDYYWKRREDLRYSCFSLLILDL